MIELTSLGLTAVEVSYDTYENYNPRISNMIELIVVGLRKTMSLAYFFMTPLRKRKKLLSS